MYTLDHVGNSNKRSMRQGMFWQTKDFHSETSIFKHMTFLKVFKCDALLNSA